ncbi:MAG: DivIVA domain-containing protein [Clostridia bacterium]|nr:DivIVA domain-containing protein [Clostridia bacterium]
MATENKKFHGRLFGYSKKEVKGYVSDLGGMLTESQNKIKLLEERLKQAETELEALRTERDGLAAEVENAEKERKVIARVLVDAEKRADSIVENAIEKGEGETKRLSVEADRVRTKIGRQIEHVRDIESASREFAEAVVRQLRESADLFEKELMGAVDSSEKNAESFLEETEAVLDIDYFENVREYKPEGAEEKAAEEAPEAANEEADEAADASAKAAENAGAPEDEDKDDAGDGANGIPEDYSFQQSDEGVSYFKVIRA